MVADSRQRKFIEAVCKGSHREMGVAQGQQLREKILKADDIFCELEAVQAVKPKLIPFWLYKMFAEFRAERLLTKGLNQNCRLSHERLKGIAEGAGVSFKSLCLLNSIEPFLSAVQDQVVVPQPGACSAVAINAEGASIDEPMLAKNFDYLPITQPFYTLRESHPDGRYRSLDFTIAPLAGTVDGMNEEGLCITNNYAYTTDESPPSITITMLISQALENCSTVEEAVKFISSRSRWGGGLLMLADASGDIASLEISNTRTQVRRPNSGENHIFHTNSFFCEKMKEVEIDRNAVFTAKIPKVLYGTRIGESAEKRANRIAELLDGTGKVGPDELHGIMADHGPDNNPSENTVCTHGPYWSTTATIQFFPKSRRLRVDYSSACNAKYDEFSL